MIQTGWLNREIMEATPQRKMSPVMLALDKGLGRLQYIATGLTLFAVRVAIDFLLARAFRRPYSILYYISPSDAPLFRPGENPTYWFAMWADAGVDPG